MVLARLKLAGIRDWKMFLKLVGIREVDDVYDMPGDLAL